MDACTIAARNYLAHARVLAESFLRIHPEARFTVLLVDGHADDGLTYGDPFETLLPEQLGLDADALWRMRAIYDVTEFSTAIKPRFLQYLLGRVADSVLYLDPDCQVFSPLYEVDGLTEQYSLVLTPHITSPVPRDGLLIDEKTIKWSGMFNLGFVAVSKDAHPFLDWWEERTRFDAIKDPEAGLFTDQRWIDFVPALFPHYVLRDRGYNVAYWNLFERPVERTTDRRLTTAGGPLRFYHFSGYDPDEPHVLSRHQLDRPRATLSEHPVVAELCAAYATALRRAGFDRLKRLPYRFDSLAGGRFDTVVRRLVRTALLDPQENDTEMPDPFGEDRGTAFVAWLNEPVISYGGGSVSRLVLGVWRARVDLQAEFPDVLGEDASRLARWARHDRDFWLTFGHLDRSSTRVRAGTPHPTPSPGLNLVGYFDAELGVGEAGRLLVKAAERSGLPLATHVYRRTLSRQMAGFEPPGPHERRYDISVFCVNADSTPKVVAEVEPALAGDLYRIGLWFWELEEFPRSWCTAFDHLDEVWVASEFTREAVQRHTNKPVQLFSLPIIADPSTYLKRSDFSVPETCFFLFCYDAFSVPERKNPIAVVEAFERAFPVEGDAFLLIKSINGSSNGIELERLRNRAAPRADIRILDDYWPRQHIAAVMQLCDCYVSLHRSEGFGLTLAAAMAHGKPVIATGYSGNLAFMDAANSMLVPYELVPVGPGNDPYPADARWAAPDIDAAAELMRRVRREPAHAREMGARGRQSVSRTHGLESSARALLEHFDRVVDATLAARVA
jgi:glycosyltransferase involved in cell wall biosynthesis